MIDELDRGENTPTIAYEVRDELAIFYRVCPKCGRFVKADGITTIALGLANAMCKKCGRVRMPFCVWLEDENVDTD